MRRTRPLVLCAAVLLAACGADSPVQPDVDALGIAAQGKPQSVACRVSDLAAFEKGKVKKNGCLYGAEGRRDLFHVDQSSLGLPGLSGSDMLVFTSEAEFDGLVALTDGDGPLAEDIFGYQSVSVAPRRLAIIGSSPAYGLFIAGNDAGQLGKYEIATTVAPSANACETGIRTFLQGTVAFSSAISDETSCLGTVEVGPFIGAPLNSQYWYAAVREGQDIAVDVQGLDGDDTSITLAVLVFTGDPSDPVPFAQLDFSAGPGDTDRSIAFTAPFDAFYYVEVSSSPGVASPYDFSFTGN